MTPPSAERVVARLNEYAADAGVHNLYAQAHARAILQELRSPATAWPKFRGDLDERLYFGAHFQISNALELLDQGKSKTEAQQALLRAAEGLEFLCKDPDLDNDVRSEQMLKAGFAYYIAGHYARSYVLINQLPSSGADLPRPLSLLLSIMQKHLRSARAITLSIFSDEALSDSGMAAELEAGTIDEDEALSRTIFSSLTAAVSLYLEYLKTGDRRLFDEALSIVNDMILVARDTLFVDWWWWSFCLRHLLLEYDRGSLWTNFSPLMVSGGADPLLLAYIRGGLRHKPPILELWPSQVQAVPIVNQSRRPNFCLKMPTSSGKTQIAEITILRFLMDSGTASVRKCAYIAPFRSLAVEVEKTLRNSLGRLGVRVSEIYGGFDLSSDDRRIIEETNVLVATPEKFDALFRHAPELASGIGLVIIDEGHIVDPNERGLNFEFFIQRLLKRLIPQKCRFLFISAVLPNASEFAEWVTGTPTNLLESEWRPSRLMIGQMSWGGQAVRIDYTHSGRDEFKQECFVPGFITAAPSGGVPGLGRRRLPFPKDKDEAFALAALQFAQTGTTLVFCPQKKQAQSFARKIKGVLSMRQALENAKTGGTFELPKPGERTPEWERCWRAIEMDMGPDAELLDLLKSGILVHHSSLPSRVRIAIEDLVRSRGIQLLVATTTLAQGVNLPIKTVLVRGLYHNYGELVSPLTFWNIMGRAGRGMQETEGQILFCVDKTGLPYQIAQTNAAIEKMISAIEKAKVESAMRLLLYKFVREWKSKHPGVDVAKLCLHLAENNLDWVSEGTRAEFQTWLDRLDGHLLALTEDFDMDPYTPDKLQEILSGSLLFIQLRDEKNVILSSDEAVAFFGARIKYIWKKHPNKSTRSRFFKLGLPLSDCESIENKKESLLFLFLQAVDWPAWNREGRAAHLTRIASEVLELRELKPRNGVTKASLALLEAWVLGNSPVAMAADETISEISDDPAGISLWIEDVCKYRLPWGINGLTSFLESYASEDEVSLPPICTYFAAMFKYGVLDPISARLMPLLDHERALAMLLADVCPLTIDDIDKVPSWFRTLGADWLEQIGLETPVVGRIMELQNAQRNREPIARRKSLSLRIPISDAEILADISAGDKVLVIPSDEHRDDTSAFALWTVKGKALGRFVFRTGVVPDWWKSPDLLVSTVIDVTSGRGKEGVLTVDTSEI